MKYLKVWQKDIVDGKSRFDIKETDETFHSVYYSAYGNKEKTIKVYVVSPNIFEVYCENDKTLKLVCLFLKKIGYNRHNNEIDTTPISTNYIHINLEHRVAILSASERPIRDYPINWEDPINHIYAYRDVSNILANTVEVLLSQLQNSKTLVRGFEINRLFSHRLSCWMLKYFLKNFIKSLDKKQKIIYNIITN